jgi:hypothetical protein
MEQNFQTSFIPKKPMVEEKITTRRSMGILVIISIFIFLTMVLVSGGAYFYKGVLTKNITKMKSDLELAKNRFEPSKIAQMKTLDKRLEASNEILSKHIIISPIFQALQEITLKTIRYTDFSYAFTGEGNNKILVKMKGQGIGYRSIALQADLFTENKNFIDPVFSGLTLDSKGNVIFDLEFFVDPSFVDYKQTLKTSSEDTNLPVLDAIINSANIEPTN